MATLFLRPSSHAVVGANEIVADEDGIVTISDAANQLAIILLALVAAAIVRGKRVGEGSRRVREEGRWEGPRDALGEEGVASLEVEGRARLVAVLCRCLCSCAGLVGVVGSLGEAAEGAR